MADLPAGVEPLEDDDPSAVGPYKLAGRLGVGGMGTVYYGRSPAGRPVAVKVIRRDFAREPHFRSRFAREAQAARRVARFCTAEVLDVDTDRAEPYLVTEFIEGPTLAGRVRRGGPLDAAELERLGVAVAGALGAIHGANLIHRDLKPGNILLSPSGARVIDFGIARSLESTTTLTHRGVIGTPAFMAPEQALGEPLTPAADIHAWGGVMLFAATGRTPHGEAITPVLLYRIVHDQPDLSGLAPELRDLVEWTMQRDPAARPTASALLLRLTGATPAPTTVGEIGTPGSAAVPRPPGAVRDSPTRLLHDPRPTAGQDMPQDGSAEEPRRARRTQPARRRTPSRPRWPAHPPRWPLVAAAIATLLATGGIGLAVSQRDRGGPTAPSPQATAAATAGVITLADYRGRTSAVAVERLRRAGFVARSMSEPSGAASRGRVIDTSPPAGTRLAPGSTVVVRIGDGSQAEARGWRVFKQYTDSSSINESPIILVSPAGAERQVGVGDNPALAPDGSRVVFTSTAGEIVSLRTAGGGDERQLTDEPDGSSDSAVYSPDGRTIAYARNIGGVFLINADGGGRQRISQVRDAFELSWSPDGTKLVYRNGADQSLHILARDGADHVLTGSPVPGAGAGEPAWSPDGHTIAFSTAAGGVFLIDADGGEPLRVGGSGTWHPSWSPQGGLVYVEDMAATQFFAATGPVHVMNPDGSGDRLLGSGTASGPVRWAIPPG
ncbi:protein kinase [Frankia sp. AgB32]|uniref:protein kinase domain-containing protein n=1 Tax=Frankia sp. AgB32 TaxID=631119 RepID=UPI00200C2493|nr:protein kinase [Frankia sp. AgB32]MCK9893531.1 protein kinase [Frankia sp. AgB32]